MKETLRKRIESILERAKVRHSQLIYNVTKYAEHENYSSANENQIKADTFKLLIDDLQRALEA